MWWLAASPYRGRQTLLANVAFVKGNSLARRWRESKFAKVWAIVFRPSGAGEILVCSSSHGWLAVGYSLSALRACDGGLGLTGSSDSEKNPRTATRETFRA